LCGNSERKIYGIGKVI